MRREGLAAIATLVLVACRDDGVTTVRVPKEAAATAPAPAAAATGATLRWTLPPGWTQGPGQDAMRFATLSPPGPGKVAGSVVVLSGPAGGELANVNRWRNQIGLPPVPDGALDGMRQVVKSAMGPIALYDLAGEGDPRVRVLAAIAPAGGSTWFVKLAGDAEAVGAARDDFLRLVESLHLGNDR